MLRIAALILVFYFVHCSKCFTAFLAAFGRKCNPAFLPEMVEAAASKFVQDTPN